jgi:murein DD-endopeptidase MepM/ murein hydrolase activator NlpD
LWRWPLLPRPPVVRRFLPPTSAWGAGHRGVDLGGAPGAVVHAVADGTVTHTGVVAGRPTVTLSHPGGLRSTYEPVRATVTTGDVVRAGDAVGVLVATGSHCAPAGCLHLGALRGTEYLDPLSLLGPRRVRLLPLSPGGPAAPARAPGG